MATVGAVAAEGRSGGVVESGGAVSEAGRRSGSGVSVGPLSIQSLVSKPAPKARKAKFHQKPKKSPDVLHASHIASATLVAILSTVAIASAMLFLHKRIDPVAVIVRESGQAMHPGPSPEAQAWAQAVERKLQMDLENMNKMHRPLNELRTEAASLQREVKTMKRQDKKTKVIQLAIAGFVVAAMVALGVTVCVMLNSVPPPPTLNDWTMFDDYKEWINNGNTVHEYTWNDGTVVTVLSDASGVHLGTKYIIDGWTIVTEPGTFGSERTNQDGSFSQTVEVNRGSEQFSLSLDYTKDEQGNITLVSQTVADPNYGVITMTMENGQVKVVNTPNSGTPFTLCYSADSVIPDTGVFTNYSEHFVFQLKTNALARDCA
eukprot:GHVT01099636.1.p1 GENE.GHVT01099636.1~~GHVT01099636.1.p1  ORF type:complete len:375 (+),score=52.00 GHVT01099636.1:241-1365(+)